MTTPLPREPRAGDGLVPFMSVLVDRLWDRLPEVHRVYDGMDDTWTQKRWLGGVLAYMGGIDATIDAIRGERPVGPPGPLPWGLAPDELVRWVENRRTRPSALGDPEQAEAAWLPWLAQLVGARLDPAASEMERRDTIRYATSGWRGGTRGAIADAARSALTGSRFVRVLPHTKPGAGGVQPGTVWDITIVTRTAETPDPGAVLGAVLRKGVKPAGAVLWHTPYQASWDTVEALLPTWADWEGATWDQIEEVGIAYAPMAGNLMPNPSFETDTSGWAARGAITTIGRVAGGVDGAGMLRVTTTGAGTGEVGSPSAPVSAGASYLVGLSLRTTASRAVEFTVEFRNGSDAVVGTTVVDVGTPAPSEWQRGQALVTVPPGAVALRVHVRVAGMASAEWFDADAVIVRSAA